MVCQLFDYFQRPEILVLKDYPTILVLILDYSWLSIFVQVAINGESAQEMFSEGFHRYQHLKPNLERVLT